MLCQSDFIFLPRVDLFFPAQRTTLPKGYTEEILRCDVRVSIVTILARQVEIDASMSRFVQALPRKIKLSFHYLQKLHGSSLINIAYSVKSEHS